MTRLRRKIPLLFVGSITGGHPLSDSLEGIRLSGIDSVVKLRLTQHRMDDAIFLRPLQRSIYRVLKL